MTEIADFFAMGGYAKYVWTSYGATVIVLVFNFAAPLIGIRRLRKRLAQVIRLKRAGS